MSQDLSSSSEAWRRFEAAVQGVTEWLDTADQMLAERADSERAVEQHKVGTATGVEGELETEDGRWDARQGWPQAIFLVS